MVLEYRGFISWKTHLQSAWLKAVDTRNSSERDTSASHLNECHFHPLSDNKCEVFQMTWGRIKICRSAQMSRCSLTTSDSHFPLTETIQDTTAYQITISPISTLRKTHHQHVFITNPRSARGKQLLQRTTHNRYELFQDFSTLKIHTYLIHINTFPNTSSIRSTTRSKNLRSMQQARRRSREQTPQGLHNLQICSLLLQRVHKSTLQSSQEGMCKAGSRILKDCGFQACGEEFSAQGGTQGWFAEVAVWYLGSCMRGAWSRWLRPDSVANSWEDRVGRPWWSNWKCILGIRTQCGRGWMQHTPHPFTVFRAVWHEYLQDNSRTLNSTMQTENM